MGCRPVAVVITHVHNYETGIKEREACSSNLMSWKPSQNWLIDKRKQRKTCADVAVRKTFRILTSNQQFGN